MVAFFVNSLENSSKPFLDGTELGSARQELFSIQNLPYTHLRRLEKLKTILAFVRFSILYFIKNK
jgi:hypothetical protein